MLANSLRSNRTQTLALILSDISNPFWTTVARGVEDEASRCGFTVIYCNTDAGEQKQAQYISMLLRRRVDGVLLVPASSSAESVRALQAHDVKVVVLDHVLQGVNVDVVRGASCEGARSLVNHLIGLGHRRIALLTGPAELFTAHERALGYCEALQAAHIPVDERLMLYGSYTVESGAALTESILQLQPLPTAIFAANNFLSAGALRTLYRHGLRVPADMSLTSFDDLPFEYLLNPVHDCCQAACLRARQHRRPPLAPAHPTPRQHRSPGDRAAHRNGRPHLHRPTAIALTAPGAALSTRCITSYPVGSASHDFAPSK